MGLDVIDNIYLTSRTSLGLKELSAMLEIQTDDSRGVVQLSNSSMTMTILLYVFGVTCEAAEFIIELY